LIDTGWRHPRAVLALEQGLAALGARFGDVTDIVCTHAHYDHYGLASHIREVADAPVLLGSDELELLNVALDQAVFDRAQDHRRWWLLRHGAHAELEAIEGEGGDADTYDAIRARGRWEAPDRLVGDGEQVEVAGRTLEAVLTPGHTRGHLMFLDRANGLLFAGDHVLPHITPSLGFEPFMDGRALERFMHSLRAVRELPAGLVLPGHGPAFADLARRVDELLAHHDTRLADCLRIVAEDRGESAAQVASHLTWTRHDRSFGELDVLNRMLAVTETVTHLELLADDGRLRRREGEQLRYAPAA